MPVRHADRNIAYIPIVFTRLGVAAQRRAGVELKSAGARVHFFDRFYAMFTKLFRAEPTFGATAAG